MVVTGKLIECRRTVKEFKKGKSEEKLFITLAEVEIKPEDFDLIQDAFKDSGKNFTPGWVKNPEEGYVNVSTKFDLPIRVLEDFETIKKGDYSSVEKCIEDGLHWMGAECDLSIEIKEGAIYPKALRLLSEGKPVNAFADFD